MIHIHLSSRNVFTWYSHKNTSVCGYGYMDGACLKGTELAQKVQSMLEKDHSATELFDRIDGFFAFVHRNDTTCVAAVDRIRSIPLFYAQSGEDLYLSDSAEWIRSSLHLHHLDKKCTAEFLIAQVVTGNETLFPEIRQIMAGEVLEYPGSDKSANPIKRIRYFKFLRNRTESVSVSEFIERLDQVHLNVFSRLAESLNGRQAVIPLSGGFDSRLIAVMMHRIGYDNMKFISYGKPGNWESRISKEIADYFQADWHFVPLSQHIWADMFRRKERRCFTFDAGNFSGHIIIQEYPVLHHMVQQGIVDKDAVFIPGHSGGFISGKHIPSPFLGRAKTNRKKLYDFILKKNYRKWDWEKSGEDYKSYFRQKVHTLLDAPAKLTSKQACVLYEEWVWQERQAKFIVNSVRNFEHFGFEWRLPLWSKSLVDFWLTVPVNLGYKQRLLKKYLKKKHKLPVTKANSRRMAKVIDRYYPTAKAWIGRYIGDKNMLQAINIKLEDVLPVRELPYDFIPPEKRVLFSHINAMGSVKYIEEILEKTNSVIGESYTETNR